MKRKSVIIGFVLLIILFVYHIIYAKTGWGIPCIIHTLTGYYCPGCGITRMLFSIIELDFAKAFRYNQFLFILIPFILFYFGYQLYIDVTDKEDVIFTKIPKWFYLVFLILIIAWGIVRNLSFFPYLRP